MIKSRQPPSTYSTLYSKYPTRKPSLPVKRTLSSASNHSCMSDRIVYSHSKELPHSDWSTKKVLKNNTTHNNASHPHNNLNPIPENSLKPRNDHLLTGFQWLIIMRHCYHLENKKRGASTIKTRTLATFIKNRMYPDSVWNKILVMPHEKKFTTLDIAARLDKDPRSKFNLDDIFGFIGKGYIEDPSDGQESAAETARFIDNLKTHPDHIASNPRPKNQNVAPAVFKTEPSEQGKIKVYK